MNRCILMIVLTLLSGCTSQVENELFDGKTLSGWRQLKFPTDHPYHGGKWTVEDGAICGEQYKGSLKGGLLVTEKKYSEFELTMDFKHDWGCDSGVFLRTNDQAAAMQIAIDHIQGGIVGFIHGQGIGSFNTTPFDISGTQVDGKLKLTATDSFDPYKRDKITYACTKEEWLAAMNPNGWNSIIVKCEGKYPLYTTWLNGTKIMILDSDSYQGRYRKDTSKISFDKEKIHKLLGTEGYIGLQLHPGKRMNGKIRYKNIKIKEL